MAMRTCGSCEGEFSEYSFPFNGQVCKKCHETKADSGVIKPVDRTSQTDKTPPSEDLETAPASSENNLALKTNQEGKKASPLKIFLMSASAIILCIFLYRAEVENEKERKRLHIAESIRVSEAKTTLNEMANKLSGYIKRIDELNKQRSSYNGLDPMLPTMMRNGEFQLPGLAINDINNQIDVFTSLSASTFEKIKQFAIDNKIDNDPEFIEQISKLKGSLATTINREDPAESWPNPGSTDIAVLVTFADQLRQTISSLPKVEPNGDPRYNAIITENTPRAIGPSAQLFNDRCYAFEKRFGKKNLQLVAAKNGFSNLLP